ncbi:MAG: hypothetical protein ACTSU2_03120 [Promethearchaeota archaeon]
MLFFVKQEFHVLGYGSEKYKGNIGALHSYLYQLLSFAPIP